MAYGDYIPSGPTLLMAGTVVKTVGNYQSNMDQARSELTNAESYRQQAVYDQYAKVRELAISNRTYAGMYGAQTSAYAAGNVDTGSGSSAMQLGITAARGVEEAAAITRRYDQESSVANLRSEQAQGMGDTLQSPLYNMVQAGTSILGGYALMQGANRNSGYPGTDRPDGGPMGANTSGGSSRLGSSAQNVI